MTKAQELLKLIEADKAKPVTSGKWKFEPSGPNEIEGWSVPGTLTSPDGKKSQGRFSYSDAAGIDFNFTNAPSPNDDEDEDFTDLIYKVAP